MKMRKLFWGLMVIGAGVLLLLKAFGLGEEYDVIRVIGSLILLGIALASIAQFRFVLLFMPLALIAYLWRVPLGIASLNIGLLLGAAALLGIGLSVIFHKKHHFKLEVNKNDDWGKTEKTLNDNELASVDASWGEHIRYIHANNLKKTQIRSSFASTKIYFDQCQVSSEGLEINVNGSFSEVVLNVPKDWLIDNQISVFAGAVTNLSANAADGKIKVLLSGSVNFAELKIVYL